MAALPGRNWRQGKKLRALAYAIACHAAQQSDAQNRPPDIAPGWVGALATLGLLDGAGQPDPDAQVEYLWPCNVKHWQLWQELRSQWRTGMSGSTGLDYAACIAHLRVAHGLRGKRLQKAWAAMREAEQGTLQAWAEQAERQRQQAPTPPSNPAAL